MNMTFGLSLQPKQGFMTVTQVNQIEPFDKLCNIESNQWSFEIHTALCQLTCIHFSEHQIDSSSQQFVHGIDQSVTCSHWSYRAQRIPLPRRHIQLLAPALCRYVQPSARYNHHYRYVEPYLASSTWCDMFVLLHAYGL